MLGVARQKKELVDRSPPGKSHGPFHFCGFAGQQVWKAAFDVEGHGDGDALRGHSAAGQVLALALGLLPVSLWVREDQVAKLRCDVQSRKHGHVFAAQSVTLQQHAPRREDF